MILITLINSYKHNPLIILINQYFIELDHISSKYLDCHSIIDTKTYRTRPNLMG